MDADIHDPETPGDPDQPEGAEQTSRFARAYEGLRRAILEGTHRPGERLTEVELVRELQVSRSTLRAAFVRLQNEGYLVLEPNRGARVRSFTPEEASEILQVRETLEGMAAGLAALNAQDHELDELEVMVSEMADATERHDGPRYQRLNRAFHAAIVTISRSQTLARFLAATQYPLIMGQFRSSAIRHPRARSIVEHRALLVALRARHAAAAEQMMRLHVSATREALTLSNESHEPPAEPNWSRDGSDRGDEDGAAVPSHSQARSTIDPTF
jgi:DNA-binding GntR family transcriptional regulator